MSAPGAILNNTNHQEEKKTIMKRSILTIAATAALTLGGMASANAATVCTDIPVPAIPAVYKTTVIPAVTVTEYEFTHAQDGVKDKSTGPANRWEANPNWNAEDNPQSVGWVATGNTRVRVIEVEKSTVELVSEEVPATTVEECYWVPDAPEPEYVNEEPAPAETVPVAPLTAEAAPVTPSPAEVTAPVAQAIEAVPVAAQPADAPEELAYTGAADWVLPAGLGLVLLGAGLTVTSRVIGARR